VPLAIRESGPEIKLFAYVGISDAIPDKAERSVRHLQHFCGGMRAGDITTARVRAYIGDRQDEGVSNGEINQELAAHKRMFNLALQETPAKVRQNPISRCFRSRT
jgi:site-specific recombinase XerD